MSTAAPLPISNPGARHRASSTSTRERRRAQTPPAAGTPRQRRFRAVLARAARLTVALALTLGTLVLAIANTAFRGFEAWLVTLALSPIVEHQLAASGYRYFVWTDADTLIALQVTLECTALIFTVPLTIAAAGALGFTRVSWWRVFAAIAALWVIIVAVNTVRLWVIGWATQTWGMDPGYVISHTLVGSIIGIIGFVLGVGALFVVLGFRRSRAKQQGGR